MSKAREVPKYQWIRDEILTRIESGSIHPGDKLPIEADLAHEFSASRQTIRQAIGELVQRGILERIQGSGTYYIGEPEKPSNQPASGIIGVITTYISDYIFPDIIRGIEERLSEEGYSPLLFTTQNDISKERKALEDILAKGVDGVIAEATKSAYPNANVDLLNRIQSLGIPVVMLHASYPDLPMPVIEVDDRQGAYEAVHYLTELGHRRIGAVMKMDDRQGLRRMEGFLLAHNQVGCTYDANHIAFYTTEQRSSIAESYAKNLASMEMEHRPTAVFCYNDQIAAQLLTALRLFHLSVPEDLSIIGFDDANVAAQCYPPLTTVEHPKHAMGTLASDWVIQLIRKNPIVEQSYNFIPHLVKRSSVRAPQ